MERKEEERGSESVCRSTNEVKATDGRHGGVVVLFVLLSGARLEDELHTCAIDRHLQGKTACGHVVTTKVEVRWCTELTSTLSDDEIYVTQTLAGPSCILTDVESIVSALVAWNRGESGKWTSFLHIFSCIQMFMYQLIAQFGHFNVHHRESLRCKGCHLYVIWDQLLIIDGSQTNRHEFILQLLCSFSSVWSSSGISDVLTVNRKWKSASPAEWWQRINC